jgi:hypothetical protein
MSTLTKICLAFLLAIFMISIALEAWLLVSHGESKNPSIVSTQVFIPQLTPVSIKSDIERIAVLSLTEAVYRVYDREAKIFCWTYSSPYGAGISCLSEKDVWGAGSGSLR